MYIFKDRYVEFKRVIVNVKRELEMTIITPFITQIIRF